MLIAYVTQINDDLPYPVFVKPRKYTAIFPQKTGQVTRFAELCSDIKGLILLPTIDICENIWVAVPFDREGCLGQVFQDVNFFPQSEPREKM